ncbi:FUSC family protein [Streptomyces sp. IBSNAI002]|uniref:FUSC family protein n=1 Tax=Streptomyces sp. IBSNAI002 TaxID=3457500 RepID=UPI003FCEFF78
MSQPFLQDAARSTLMIAGTSVAAFAISPQHAAWLVYTLAAVLQPLAGSTTERAVQRVVGSIIGATAAALAVGLGQLPVAALIAVTVTAGLALRPLNHTYWALLGTPTALLLSGFVQPGDENTVLTRVIMTFIGTGIALAGSYFLWPASNAASGNVQVRTLTHALNSYRHAVLAGAHDQAMRLSVDVDAQLRTLNTSVYRADSGRRADRTWATQAEQVRQHAAALCPSPRSVESVIAGEVGIHGVQATHIHA